MLFVLRLHDGWLHASLRLVVAACTNWLAGAYNGPLKLSAHDTYGERIG